MPKVSVIVPNYNHSNYLEQRIDSILNQTFQDFELIILDDKSTDNSRAIIEKYRSHPKVSQIVYNEVNSGTTFKQWNKGFRLAKGELVWIAESDDDSSPDFLEVLVAKFDQYPTLGIAYCNSYALDGNNVRHRTKEHWKNDTFHTSRWNSDYFNAGKAEVNDYLIFHTIIENVSCALIKKAMAIEAGLADESFRYAGDANFYMRVLLLSDVYYVSQPLNYFRDHTSNTSKQAFVSGARPLEEILAHAKVFRNNNKINKEARAKRLKQAIANYKWFTGITLKDNKSIAAFIAGNKRLWKANPGYAAKIVKGYVSQKLFH